MSKSEIEWIDTKMEKETIDIIATHPPETSKNRNNKKILKVYDELFYQADYVLKKHGKMVLINKTNKEIIPIAKKNNFIYSRIHKIFQGKEEYVLTEFMKNANL